MRRSIDITGHTYGRLVVLRFDREDSHKNRYWTCLCECGVETSVRFGRLRSGYTKSCGCLIKERAAMCSYRHGCNTTTYRSPEYSSWNSMKQRCLNPNSKDYANYGGRGISVCDSWQDSFQQFFEDMGIRPEGTTLDRMDNDGNYEPGNCRWATAKEQNSNRRATA